MVAAGTDADDHRSTTRALARAGVALTLLLAAACHPGSRVASAASSSPVSPASPIPTTPCASEPTRLHEQREQAVRRGVAFMADYLESDPHLEGLATDAVEIFLELALTSASDALRTQSDAIARRHARRLLPHYLTQAGVQAPWDFCNGLDLLIDAPLVGLESEPLAAVLTTRFHAFTRDDEVYGVPLSSATGYTDDQVFTLMLEAYALERADVRWPGRFPVRFRFEDALRVVWQRPLAAWASSGDAAEHGVESAYLATHVPLVLSEYGRHPFPHGAAARFVQFLQREFTSYLRVRDVEIVAETADVLRQTGHRDETDMQLCSATQFLLSTQNADGSWGDWRNVTNPYDAIHKTWAAVTGLVERDAGSDGPYARRVREILTRVER